MSALRFFNTHQIKVCYWLIFHLRCYHFTQAAFRSLYYTENLSHLLYFVFLHQKMLFIESGCAVMVIFSISVTYKDTKIVIHYDSGKVEL